MSTQKYPKTILEAVYLAGKSMLEWIGTAGGIATLDANSRLEQVPFSNTIEGYLNLTLLATANSMISIANALPSGSFRFYIVTDITGGLAAGSITMNPTVALLFGSSVMGASVGDMIMISNISGTKSYKIIPLNSATASSGTFPGNSGLLSNSDKTLVDSIPNNKNSVLVCIACGYGYSSTDLSSNVYGGTPSVGDLVVGNVDHGVSHTDYAPAILRYNGEVFEVMLYGSQCVGKFVFVNDAETGYMLPYYIGGEAIVNMAPLWPYCITNMLLGTESVTGDKIASNTIIPGHFVDALFDALNPFYLNQINGPVYLKISALQMSTPTDAAWVSYPTTLAVWDAVKNAVTNGIPVYLVDLFPLVANTSKYLCTVMYYQNHGREGVGSFLFQYNSGSSTTISGFKLTRSGSTFSCVSF